MVEGNEPKLTEQETNKLKQSNATLTSENPFKLKFKYTSHTTRGVKVDENIHPWQQVAENIQCTVFSGGIAGTGLA